MKNFLMFFFVLSFSFLISSCNDIKDNPVTTNNSIKDSPIQPTFTLQMDIVQNGNKKSYLLYSDGTIFSYPMYGCYPNPYAYVYTNSDAGSTFDVYLTYSWTDNTANYIAGQFTIYRTEDSFMWQKYIFCNGNSSGSIQQTWYNVPLQISKTYRAYMCNGYFDDDGGDEFYTE